MASGNLTWHSKIPTNHKSLTNRCSHERYPSWIHRWTYHLTIAQASGLWGKPKPRHVGSIIALGACPVSSLIPSPQYSTSPTMVYSGDGIHKSQVKLVVLGFPSPDLSPPVLAAAFDREGASKDSSRAETCMPGAAVSASEPKLWWSYLQLTGKKIHEFGRVFPQNRRSHVVNPTINLRASDFRDDYLPPFSDKIADGLLIQCGLLPYLGMGQVETNMNMMVLTHSYVCV